MEALWPEQPPRTARLHTEASRARKALGLDDGGSPLLPPAELGRYRLSNDVGLDHDRFTALVELSRSDLEAATVHLMQALELVRGTPLSSTVHEYTWATNDAHRLTQQVVDVAHVLAEKALEGEEPDLAAWAAEQGLVACPHAEALYRDLMCVAAARGDAVRLPSIMARLREVLLEDVGVPDADDWVSKETMSLYEHLRGRGRRIGVAADGHEQWAARSASTETRSAAGDAV